MCSLVVMVLPGGPPALSGAAVSADLGQTGGGTAVGSGGQFIGQAAAGPGWRPMGGAGPVSLNLPESGADASPDAPPYPTENAVINYKEEKFQSCSHQTQAESG